MGKSRHYYRSKERFESQPKGGDFQVSGRNIYSQCWNTLCPMLKQDGQSFDGEFSVNNTFDFIFESQNHSR